MRAKRFFTLFFVFFTLNFCLAQIVPIQNFSLNSFGQAQIEIAAEADKYYLLSVQHPPGFTYESITSMKMGVDGNLIITEPLAAFAQQNYRVTAHSIANPDDTDGDGIDDVTEFNNTPDQAPLNFAGEIPIIDGTIFLDSYDTYSALAVVDEDIPWAPFLNNQEFAKFAILNQNTDEPEVYFINSETHYIHASFLGTINTTGADIVTGEIVYNPNIVLPNGAIGSYSFNYSFGSAYSFEQTRRTFELLAANMPFLQNNFRHFIGDGGENAYINQYQDDYVGSRLEVILESELFADVDFLPFNQTEGYGFFRVMQLDENPASRDIVLYDALPNSLPRVGGIITSVVQTPLSHVNLRAIQDNVPNAYIRNPLDIDSIANLVGNYIYYKVEAEQYFIREATLEEVNAWYENQRPTEAQIPDRDLSQTRILPLDSIGFEMSTSFGAKCSNVATMRGFGFPEGTIPNGFGIPFYYYDEFMKFNGFYDDVEDMISDPDFINDLETRIDMLKDFRDEIKDAPMPQWMLDDLQAMHDAFPEGTAVRCRSSTNNEDLPGFSGAGLYTSKTQHLDEGHIQKSIKQVYASMWNFRAFDERDFYRVDHYIAAMGILCHPNFQEEKSNGVGVSIDPVFNTENTFYLNTQVGEFLITNPDANSIPEEILLSTDPAGGYVVLRESNLVPIGELVMGDEYLNQMREYLQVIHDKFAVLYNVVGAEGFGMDIEYKVTAEDQLIIKQARPWVSFWADIKATYDLTAVEITEPQSSSTLGAEELVRVNIANKGLKNMDAFEISLLVEDEMVETLTINEQLTPQTDGTYQFTIPQDFSEIGTYNIGAIVTHPDDGYLGNDTVYLVLNKLHLLEGEMILKSGRAKCGNEVELAVSLTNYGEATFNETKIEVLVNGMPVDTVTYDFSIPYLTEVEITILVTENLQSDNNEIILNLLTVNGQEDAVLDNNSVTFSTGLESNYEEITFVLNPDNFPQEISWELYDLSNEELVSSGFMVEGQGQLVQNICVDYNNCFSLKVSDSFGDGICCGFGFGGFNVNTAEGDMLVNNNGEFTHFTEELFCPNGQGCAFTANMTIKNATAENASDGVITIIPTTGLEPYMYSVDGGQSYTEKNTFTDLTPGDYLIMVMDASGTCSYEETVTIGVEIVSEVEDLSIGSLKVYPNPVQETLVIEAATAFLAAGKINIELYDYLGRQVQTNALTRSSSESKAIISMQGFAAGCYFVKCYNDNFEQHFKVIKID